MRKRIFLTLAILLFLQSTFVLATTPFTSKPNLGATINWAHPLSKGLVGVWLMNEGGGGSINNSINDSNKFILKNNAVWTISQKGAGLKTSGVSNYAVLTNPTSILKPAKEVTIIWYGTILGDMVSSNGNPRLASMEYNSIDSPPYVCYFISRVNANQDAIYFAFNNGTFQGTIIDAKVDYNIPTMFALSIGSKADFYKNNKNIGNSLNVGTISYTSTSLLLVGSHYTNPALNDSNCITSEILIYNRALSPSEIAQLYQEPYCFIEYKPWTMWGTAVAAVRRFFIID